MIFCFLVALYGRNIAAGFWGMLIMSVLLTPLITGLLYLLFRRPKSRKRVVYRYKVSDIAKLKELDL